jgi:hypothetical protein
MGETVPGMAFIVGEIHKKLVFENRLLQVTFEAEITDLAPI